MGSITQGIIIAVAISAAVAYSYDRPPSADPSDITSINNLRDKNGIESIILRVIKKIRETGTLPADFPHDDYLRLLSAHQAVSEDLGSVEFSGEISKGNDFTESGDGEFGKKLAESKKNYENKRVAESRSSGIGKYYISSNDTVKCEIVKSGPQKCEPVNSVPANSEPSYSEPANSQPAYSETANSEPAYSETANSEPAYSETANSEPSYSEPANSQPAYSETANSKPSYSEPANSQPEKNEQEKSNNLSSRTYDESTTKTEEVQSETTPPPDVKFQLKETQTEEPTVSVSIQPTTTVQTECETTYPSSEVQQIIDYEGNRYEPVENTQDSEKSDCTEITEYPSSANANDIPREGRKTDSVKYYQVEAPRSTESQTPQREGTVHLGSSEEDQPYTNLLAVQSRNEERTNQFSVQYDFVPSAMESKLIPTKPTPGSDIVVNGPTPIDIPDAQYQDDENTTPLLLSFRRNVSSVAESDKEEKKNKYENVRHTVEFAPSPLVAAFTVQQDDKGIPRNIVPLDYAHSTPPPAPTEDPDIVAQRQRELEEKEFILYQQLKSLQQEKSRYISPQQQQQILLQQKQEEMKRQQALYNNLNYYYHHSYQRRPEYVQKEQTRQQVYQEPSQYLRYQELQSQKLHRHRNNFQPNQGFEFHKSVDYSVPQYEHNRVHRREPSHQIGNFGYNSYPSTVSGQIQSLINTSGIGYGLPRNTQADLSVVSKILALNHGGLEPSPNPAYRQNQNSIPFK